MDAIDEFLFPGALDEVDAKPGAKELALGVYLSLRIGSGVSHLAAFAAAGLLERFPELYQAAGDLGCPCRCQ